MTSVGFRLDRIVLSPKKIKIGELTLQRGDQDSADLNNSHWVETSHNANEIRKPTCCFVICNPPTVLSSFVVREFSW